jgi:hypothetical protein
MKVLIALLLIVPFGVVSAHTTGASFEKTVEGGKYKVDIGYDPSDLVAGERMVLDFSVRKIPSLEPVHFDHVWVRLVDETDTLLATGVAQMPFGPTTLLYVIPETVAGDLKLSMRFEDGERTIAETEVMLPVEPAPKETEIPVLAILSCLVGLLVGAGVVWVAKGNSLISMAKKHTH